MRPAIRRLARILASCAASCALFCGASDARAQTFTWTNAAGGTFNVASNWSPAGGPPNSATESAVFGPASLFTVTFTGNVTNQHLSFGTSFANFAGNGAATTPTYSLAGDATLSSGLVIVGGVGRPLNWNVADQLTVLNSALTVGNGSDFTALRMSMAPPAGGTGTVSVTGAGTTFAITGASSVNIGGGTSAGTAHFALGGGAAGTFAGPLSVVQTTLPNQVGALHVTGGASLTAQSGIRVGNAGASGQLAQIFVSGANSRVTQTGTGTVAVGAATGSRGTIQVADGATFTTGAGTTTVNALGLLSVIGGQFEANGTLVSSGGLIEVDGGVLNANVATTLTGGTLLIGKSVVGSGGGFVNFHNSFTAGSGAHIAGVEAEVIASGTALLSGNSTVDLAGSSARFVAVGATFTTGSALRMSGGSAAFGSLTVTGAGTQFDLANNVFTAIAPVALGDSADVSVADSEVTLNGALTVGTGAAATFTNSAVRVAGPASIPGGELNFVGGAATFNGTATVGPGGALNVASAGFRAGGTVNINGGQVNVGTGSTFNSASFTSITNGTFNMTGGVATFANALVTSNAHVSVGHASTLVIPDGNRTFSGGTVALAGTGTIDFTGSNLTFDDAAFSFGTFQQPDNVINFLGSSRMIGATLNVRGTTRLTDASQGTLSSSISVGSDGPGLLAVDGAGAGLTLGNFLNVSAAGTADFRNSAKLDAERISMNGGVMTLTLGADAVTTERLNVLNGARLTVSGPGTTLTAGRIDGAGIGGTLAIANGASVSITGTISYSSTTGGMIDLSGGTFHSNGSIIVSGNGAAFRKTGGVFHLDIAHTMEVSDGGVAEFLNGVHVTQTSNIFNVFDGGTLRFGDGVRLGEFGVMGAMSGTGSILVTGAAASLSVGAGGATVGFGTGGRGTIDLRNGASGTIVGPTRVGMNGSVGTFLVNGAAATLGDVLVGVGAGGNGTFAASGPTISFGNVSVGVSGGSGTFSAGSTATITMGNLSVGETGTGLATIGGSATTLADGASITVGAAAGPVTGRLAVNSGTLRSGTGPISIRPGGSLSISARLVARGPVLDIGSNLSITGSGQLDLTDQTRFIDYTGASPIASVRNQLVSGYANGSWTGTGINSSAAAANAGFALGFAEASELFTTFPASFQGRAVDATTLLVTYTRYGDANLDRAVNLQDFNRLAANFGATNATWFRGDFNYDGAVNLQDFNRLAGNFGLAATGLEVTPRDWANLAAAVPEPVSGAVVLMLIGCTGRWRRRGPIYAAD